MKIDLGSLCSPSPLRALARASELEKDLISKILKPDTREKPKF